MQFEKRYDVAVVGAGIAGVAAAVASARAGRRTALIEKTVLVGGLATTGLINIYLPLCDGQGHQVTFGIAEELLRASFRFGPGDVPEDWSDPASRSRYRTAFSAAAYVLSLDELLVQTGVDVWLDTLACLPVMDGDRVVGVEVENKSGRGVLHAGCVVDATGDADVASRAGAECFEGQNWVTIWCHQVSLEGARKALADDDGTALMESVRTGGGSTGANAPPGSKPVTGTRGDEVTQFVLEGREMLREHYRTRQQEGGDNARQNLYPITLPSMPQFRMVRGIRGRETLADGQHGKSFADSVGVVADWRKPGFVWEVPYGTLVPRRTQGLLAAGRCICSVGDAWEVTRVIPVAALTGEAAGTAAAIASERSISPEQVDVAELQGRLRAAGGRLHLSDVLPRQEQTGPRDAVPGMD